MRRTDFEYLYRIESEKLIQKREGVFRAGNFYKDIFDCSQINSAYTVWKILVQAYDEGYKAGRDSVRDNIKTALGIDL
jgi:hypothetical protein